MKGTANENHHYVDFKSLLENMSDIVWSLSWPKLDVLYVSPSIQKVFGTNHCDEAMKHENWMEKIHPEDRRLVHESFEKVSRQGLAEVTIRVHGPQGKTIWLQLKSRLFNDAEGKPTRLDVIGSDVTSILENEHTKTERQTLLDAVMNSIQEGVSFLDADLTIRKVNHTIEKWHFDKGNMIGRKCFEAYHGRQDPCDDCPTMAAMKTGKLVVKEYVAKTSLGEKWLQVNSYPVINQSNNSIDGVVEFVRDISKQKEALQQLRESKAEYKAVVENQTDMICRFLPDTTLTFVNQVYCEVFGQRQEELIGKKFLELVPESDHQAILEQLGKLDENNRTKAYEHHMIMPDGSQRWSAWLDTAVLDDAGRVVQFQSVGRDITDKKRIEMALEKTLEKLQAFFEHAPLPLFIVDHHAKLVKISQHGAQLHECSPDQLVGKTLDQLFPKSNTAKMNQDIETVFKSQKPLVAIDDVIIGEGKKVFQAWLFPIKKTKAEEGLVGGIIFDLTDRLQAENTIINERMRLQNILDGTRAGTWEWDLVTGEVVVNERWADMIGYTLEELLPMNEAKIKQLSHPDDVGPSSLLMEQHFKGKSRYYENEVRIKHKDGHWVWVITRGQVSARKEDGTPLMMQGTHLDITSRKYMEEALRKANDKLKEAIEEVERSAKVKSQFLSTVSHEIRTPLNAIAGFSQLLQKTELSSKQQKYLTTILTSSDLLIKLINNILDFSKFEAKKTTLNLNTINLKNLLIQTISMFRAQAKNKGIQIKLNLVNDLPEAVTVDPVRLKQVLVNLLTNAITYTDEGCVELAVAKRNVNGTRAIFDFFVKDTGIGISKEDLDLVFIPFFQSRNNRTQLRGGTGLGLAITKEIIQCMGGNIHVSSKVGEGSVFSFSIELDFLDGYQPLLPSGQGDMENEVQCPIKDFISEDEVKIVIAEDIETNRELTHVVIKELLPNAIIFEAADGAAALQMIREIQPSIVLMDIQMPVMDGISVTKQVRMDEQGGGDHINIIALTAGVTEEEREKCLLNGCDAFLTKPFSYEKLIFEIKKCLVNKTETATQPTKINDSDQTRQLSQRLLKRLNNDYNVFYRITDTFIRDCTTLLDEMQDAIAENDVVKLGKAAHACKGVMSVLKMTDAFDHAVFIEKRCRENRVEEAKEAYEKLENIVSEIIKELEVDRVNNTKI